MTSIFRVSPFPMLHGPCSNRAASTDTSYSQVHFLSQFVSWFGIAARIFPWELFHRGIIVGIWDSNHQLSSTSWLRARRGDSVVASANLTLFIAFIQRSIKAASVSLAKSDSLMVSLILLSPLRYPHVNPLPALDPSAPKSIFRNTWLSSLVSQIWWYILDALCKPQLEYFWQ